MSSKLFIIVKKTGKTKKPIQAFIEDSMEKAKLYFQSMIWDKIDKINYELRWIGKFEDGKLKINDIFIQAGWQNKETNEKPSIQQIKLKYDFYLNPNNNFKDKIKTLFDGTEL